MAATPAKRRAYYERNRDRELASNRAYRQRDPEKWRRLMWAAKGVPIPSRPEPEVCDICEKVPKNGKRLCVDHDHKTGTFRGWLCRICNTSLAQLGDDVDGIRKVLKYLESK
jgi:hypothetical protein